MPYENQSNIFRYIIPCTLLLIFISILSPELVLGELKSIQNVLILGSVVLIVGFVIDVVLLPVIVVGIQKIMKIITKKPVIYDCIGVIQNLKKNEVERIENNKVRDFIDLEVTPISIFDAYINENENNNTVRRLFFLFDLLHSMSNCLFISIIALSCPIVCYLLDKSINVSSVFMYYSVVLISLIIFAKLRQNYYNKANNFMHTLVTKDIERLRTFIRKTIAGTIIAHFKSNDEKYFKLYTEEKYGEIILSLGRDSNNKESKDEGG